MSAAINTDNIGPLIWVLCHNEAKRDEHLIRAEVMRLHSLKTNTARMALINALCSSVVYLQTEARNNAERALSSGLLLFCWPGTKVLEGGVA